MKKPNFPLPKNTHTVILGLGDLNGIMRGKRIPAERWGEICKNGNAFSLALFAVDMTCTAWDTPYVSFENGYPDFHMEPAHKPVPIGWEQGVAFCFAKTQNPVPIDPRQVLIRQVERAKKLGIEIKVGTELEFYLLHPKKNKPKDKGIGMYSLDKAAELEYVLGPIRKHLLKMGIPVEQSNPEYAMGQAEVNIKYDEALLAADRVVIFRSMVKQIAAQHNLRATFMSKPFYEQGGSGFHCHYSLWKGKKNILAEKGKLSKTAMHFIGGIQKRMAESSICGAATPNAFKRKTPDSFCPINNSWGFDNRTVALRAIEGNENTCRIEKRDAGADCNPYLLIATDIAAGLDGIEQKLTPTKPTKTNAYKNSNKVHAQPIPLELSDAINKARKSNWLKKTLGEQMHEIICQQATREQNFFKQQITKVELERYLTSF